jgi:hypothetical protein
METKHKDAFNISPRTEAADWEATCLIYSDAKTSWKLERQQPEHAYNKSLVKKMNFHPSSIANSSSRSQRTTTTATSNSPRRIKPSVPVKQSGHGSSFMPILVSMMPQSWIG